MDVLDGDILNIESDVVTRDGLLQLLVMHLDGLDLSGDHGGSEGDDHTGLQDTGLNTTDGHCANTTNLVDILERDTEGLLDGTLGGDDVVKSLKESGTLPPGHVGGRVPLSLRLLTTSSPPSVPSRRPSVSLSKMSTRLVVLAQCPSVVLRPVS